MRKKKMPTSSLEAAYLQHLKRETSLEARRSAFRLEGKKPLSLKNHLRDNYILNFKRC